MMVEKGMQGEMVEVDPRFSALVPDRSQPELLYDQCTFTEGPVWFADLQCLLWSDIPNNRILRWAEGQVSIFRADSHFANGNTRDRQGRLVTCEHGLRRVSRTEVDGRITIIADSYAGKRLNSPNDVVVRSDGSIWFTDPDYGLRQNLPGTPKEQDGDYVFRVDPRSGKLEVVADDFVKPNGLTFSPDEKTLYVADSAVSDGPDLPSHIRAFRVADDGTLSGGAVFAITNGIPDGLRADTSGNIWTSAGPGVNVYTPAGEMLGRIGFPQDVTNLTFGGVGGNSIFVTTGPQLYAVRVAAQGAQWP
jgi:gluconolactonase